MLFTVITFFQKFATVLFLTIVMATGGSFIVFLSLSDTLGPTKPTAGWDYVVGKCCGKHDTEADATSKLKNEGKPKELEEKVIETDGFRDD